ncbi:MAG TPA: hypothetical protein VEV83_07710 [Parafilimonas sp.]|nr:hypothetical protein [Parafilimonas sp.]
MKKTNDGFRIVIACTLLMSVMLLNSCSKNMQDKSAGQDNAISDATGAVQPVAIWNFDSSWNEAKQHLTGVPHQKAKFSKTSQAHLGKAAFLSPDSGYVSYDNAGTALPNLTTGLTVDFWVFPQKASIEAHTIFCIPQTGAFWPTQHVITDAWSAPWGDTGLVKVMFKANKAIDYNERWKEARIPHFFGKWNHIQYSYDGATSEYTIKINGVTYVDHEVQYTDGTNTTLLGNLNPNPGSHGVVIGAFQNEWDPGLFGAAQPWMHWFAGRIDQLKIYNTALF